MIRNWLMLGFSHESFWDQTPATLELTAEALKERQVIEHDQRAWLAWTVAALMRQKRLPDLDKVKAKKAPSAHWEKQLDDLKAWVIATGGKVIVKSKDN